MTNEVNKQLSVSSSPHVKTDENTRSIMLDVCIALFFPLAIGTYFFGFRALTMTCVSVVSCVVFEYLYRKILKKSNTVGDLSAVVTGILLAFTLPVATPYWIPVVGAFFAIVIVKQLYGGLGKNFLNPALAARAFLMISFAPYIKYSQPTYMGGDLPLINLPDLQSVATPLNEMKNNLIPNIPLKELFFGEISGSIGETSALLLLLGGLYLIVRKVITPRIPIAMLGTVAVVSYFTSPSGVNAFEWMLYSLCTGGLVLGAVFMATDYATSPVTKRGQLIFGIGCGLLSIFIREFGGYPEGVCFAILLMNTIVWMLDKMGMPRRFGVKPFAGLREKLSSQKSAKKKEG